MVVEVCALVVDDETTKLGTEDVAMTDVDGDEPAEAVTKHEQADEIADGESLHFETYAGRLVVAVLTVVVYVTQNSPASVDFPIICRRQLLRWHDKG